MATNEKLPRLYPNWQDQPGLFERYWDKAMKRIEDLEKKLSDYVSTHP